MRLNSTGRLRRCVPDTAFSLSYIPATYSLWFRGSHAAVYSWGSRGVLRCTLTWMTFVFAVCNDAADVGPFCLNNVFLMDEYMNELRTGIYIHINTDKCMRSIIATNIAVNNTSAGLIYGIVITFVFKKSLWWFLNAIACWTVWKCLLANELVCIIVEWLMFVFQKTHDDQNVQFWVDWLL